MDVETCWGKIRTREFHSAYTQSHSVLLKDNPTLDLLFRWLDTWHLGTFKASKFSAWQELGEKIRSESEAEWYYDPSVPRMVIHSRHPLLPDYRIAVKDYLDLLFYLVYGIKAQENVTMAVAGKGELSEEQLVAAKKWCETTRAGLDPACTDSAAIISLEQHCVRRLQDALWKKFAKEKGLL